MIGTVKSFDDLNKGFGFITPDEGGDDVFVHIRAVERAGLKTLVSGQRVSFDVVLDGKTGRSQAGNIRAFKPREPVKAA